MCIQRIYEKSNYKLIQQNTFIENNRNINTISFDEQNTLFDIVDVRDINYQMLLFEYYVKNKRYNDFKNCLHLLLSILSVCYMIYNLMKLEPILL
jgi:hypothetical protein